ncbi:hypothetical protein R1flu_013939 [Riccia fluitans]|uniref:Uncharacterized protein n=1 Tax=Riccia fluitans TaxID=41844 RepID=A0ABD1YEP3_9MARC
MRDLLNATRKTPIGGSAMLQPSWSRRRIEKNVSIGSRHRMNRKEYEMIIGYLEDPEHLVEILGSERKTKVSEKHPSKQIAFDVMAVHLASLGFLVCIGAIMQKKFDRMYAIFGYRANIVPLATTKDGLPPELEVEEDSSIPFIFLYSQVIIEISEHQFDLPTENQFIFQPIGNEGGSNVEVDENAHAETENDEEFGDDGGADGDALDDETRRRSEEELEAQPFVYVQ